MIPEKELDVLEVRATLMKAAPRETWPKLEDIAIDNEEQAAELIETLLFLGANPLEPNSQKPGISFGLSKFILQNEFA